MRKPSFVFVVALVSVFAARPALAENLDVLMSNVFNSEQATYIGFESVEREDIPTSALVDRKYLIVDFRLHSEPAEDQLQASVHKVCMALLKDRDLIRTLSDSGYDMISVAFDRRSQFDCL